MLKMNGPLPAPTNSDLPRRDLLFDPEGETCARVPVFRHPLYRKLQPICYLGMPALLLVSLLISPPYSFFLALCGSALFLSLVWLSLLVAHQHGRLAGWWGRVIRRARGLRFLCPNCLHFGPVLHACGACGGELEPFVVHTRGFYLNDCAQCRARIFPTSWAAGTPPSARCGACGSILDAGLHAQRVRVVGVLSSRDLETVAGVANSVPDSGRGTRSVYRDAGPERVYVLNLDEVGSGVEIFSERHAARAVEALWLDTVLDDPLSLGEAIDRFLRRTGCSEARRQSLPVFIAREELSPAVRNVVAGRFGHVVLAAPAETSLRAAAHRAQPGEKGA